MWIYYQQVAYYDEYTLSLVQQQDDDEGNERNEQPLFTC